MESTSLAQKLSLIRVLSQDQLWIQFTTSWTIKITETSTVLSYLYRSIQKCGSKAILLSMVVPYMVDAYSYKATHVYS